MTFGGRVFQDKHVDTVVDRVAKHFGLARNSESENAEARMSTPLSTEWQSTIGPARRSHEAPA